MNIGRINTVLLHSWYHFTHSMETWVDLFWNSTVQIVLFSFLATAVSHGGDTSSARYMVVGMIFLEYDMGKSIRYGFGNSLGDMVEEF